MWIESKAHIESIDRIALLAIQNVHSAMGTSSGAMSLSCTLSPPGTGRPTLSASPSAPAAVHQIPAFHVERASLFVSLGALSFCLFRLISSLPLVRKGHEAQARSSLLPSPSFGKWTPNFFSFLPFYCSQSCRD